MEPWSLPAGQEASSSQAAAATSEGLDANAEINYIYLTFDRSLPLVNALDVAPGCPHPRTNPPPAPDLSKYIDPTLWAKPRKNIMLALSCIATFLTAYTAGSYSSPASLMQADLDAPSRISVLAGITTFCGGFALAPMFLAPFSEINGRYPVFIVSGTMYVVFQAVCGLVTTLPGMLIARFLVGIGGSVFSTMVGGVIADLWQKEHRNTPMALFSGAVLMGTGTGPLIAAVITQRLGDVDSARGVAAAWKWVFWHQVITSGLLMLAIAYFFKESRGPVLLSRKACAINTWYEELEKAGFYGVWLEQFEASESPANNSEQTLAEPTNQVTKVVTDEEKGYLAAESYQQSMGEVGVRGRRLVRVRWRVKADEERSSIGKMITISVTRPFYLLITEPVVFFFSLWVAFAWAVLYLTFGSIPLVFQRRYNYDMEKSGRVFAAMMAGAAVATAIAIWQGRRPSDDRQHQTPQASTPGIRARLRRRFPPDVPEARLYLTCATGALLPVGLFLFGASAAAELHPAVPGFAIFLATIGIYSVYLAIFNYFADAYGTYASSALAAQSCCRNLLAGAFPLVTGALLEGLGELGAGCVLGAVATVLTVVPFVLVVWGKEIRARSRFATKLQNA